MEDTYRQAYDAYQEMLAAGVAREVARAVLPGRPVLLDVRHAATPAR